jgi:hypothetical protein
VIRALMSKFGGAGWEWILSSSLGLLESSLLHFLLSGGYEVHCDMLIQSLT